MSSAGREGGEVGSEGAVELPATSTASPGSPSCEELAALQVVGVAAAGEPVDLIGQPRMVVEGAV